MLTALIILLLILLVLCPLAQRERERALAQRLKKTRDPLEAMLAVDEAMYGGRKQGRWVEKLRESYEFWLR